MESVEGVRLSLVGRERELALLEDLVRRAGIEGSSYVVHGEAGVGKSVLVAEASRRARDLGLDVMTTRGVQSEAHLPFAALHQLLLPCLPHVENLPAPQRSALLTAFGMADEAAPDPFLIALAALELLGEQAARSPLLLVVEDAQWIDRPSADALLFVARRVGMEPIVLMFAVREGLEDPFTHAGLPSLEVGPLDPAASNELLDAHAPDLEPDIRARVLDEAAGNPLALVELPLALRSAPALESARDPLPLTAKLERVFAARVSELPDRTRTLLVVAAANEGGALTEVFAAASALTGATLTVEDVEPAVAARVVEIDHAELSFRHPLVRSAIYQSAGIAERNRAHAALAAASPADSDQRVWHRAASVLGIDEVISSELEEAAARSLRRGAFGAAAAALERAAALTADAVRRGSLLLQAAEIEWQLGRGELIVRLLHETEKLKLSPHDRARLGLMLEVFDDRGWSGASRASEVIAMADERRTNGDADGALDTLLGFALRCWWGNPDDETRYAVAAAAERIGLDDDSPGVLEVIALADPVGRGAAVVDRLSRIEVPADPIAALRLGTAASAVWAFDLAVPLYEAAIGGMRAQGRLGWLTQALGYQAWAAVHLAKEELAVACAEEAVRLAHETHQPRSAATAGLARAAIAAERGDSALAAELTEEAERSLVRHGANPLLALVQFVRGREAVAHQRYAEGLHHLGRILEPADLAYQPLLATWAYADLVEAAASTGDLDLASEHLRSLESLAAATVGPLLEAQAAFARPIVADDDEAEALYQTAIETGLKEWPCFRGRALLWYGSWLRRQRRVAESRAPLRAARELFDALRFRSMADRARQELRASGETSRRRVPEARDELTPQELQIARMAAGGLSNREIGQRLYLSHRTVGSHLYRIFPKLDVTSRSQLAGALDS